MTETTQLPQRDARGRLLPGGPSLNPNGRGTSSKKSLIVQQRQDLEIALRAYPELEDHLVATLQRVIIQSKQGCRKSQKLLLDKFLPNAKDEQSQEDGDAVPTRVIIKDLTLNVTKDERPVYDVTEKENNG